MSVTILIASASTRANYILRPTLWSTQSDPFVVKHLIVAYHVIEYLHEIEDWDPVTSYHMYKCFICC